MWWHRAAKRWPLLLFVAAIVALLLWVVLTAFHAGTEQADRIAGIASAVFGAAALVGQFGRGLTTASDHRVQGPAASSELEEWAEGLARAVQAFWRAEEANRQIHDPVPLPVRWHAAPAALRDDWANIRRHPTGPAGGDEPVEPLVLDGRLEQIGEVYERIPSWRLVVLGSAGAGKTVLAGRLAQQLLTARRVGDPVPVLVSLAAWNPATTSLHAFLVEQLIRDHPGLSAEAGEATRAAALVTDERILPILDGFDELAQGLHEHALRHLNTANLPLVITSREQAYETATQRAKPLTAAAAIALEELTWDDLAAYLPRTVAGDRTGTWDAVLERIQTHPETPEAARLHRVLTTPLMVFLARTTYSDIPGQDPTELLDPDRFPTEQALQQYLLAQFVPAAYGPTRPADEIGGRARRGWSHGQASRYLTSLANHLHRAGTRDLAWWQLRDTIPRPRRTLILATTDALVMVIALGMGDLMSANTKISDILGTLENGIWTLVASGLTVAIAAGLSRILTSKATLALGTALIITGLTAAFNPGSRSTLGGAIEDGLMFGTVSGVVVWVAGRRTVGPPPARARVQIRGRIRILAIRYAVGFGIGFVYGFGAAIPAMFEQEGNFGSRIVVIGITFGLMAGLAAILVYGLEAPLHADEVASPTESLARDRANSLRKLLGVSLLISCVAPLTSDPVYVLQYALLVGWLSVRVTSAWFFWAVLARGWLPLTGRLPWRMQSFLDDAHHRGVLRQTGAVYQFRHAALQDHFTTNPPPPQHQPN